MSLTIAVMSSISAEKESIINRWVIQNGKNKFRLIGGGCEELKHGQLHCTDRYLVDMCVIHCYAYSMETYKPMV